MKRRHLLAGAAALPFAGMAVDVESRNIYAADAADDPAIEAARRWLAAWEAERRSAYCDWDDDDPRSVALTEEAGRCWQEMQETPPTTAAGLALMMATFLYAVEGSAAGAHFHDPESWYIHGIEGAGGTAYRMLPALWRSPAAAELFKDLPAGGPKDYLAEREKAAEAFNKALGEAEKRPYEPTWGEMQGAMIASEAAGKPISEDEAIALLRAHGTREAA